MPQVAPTFRPLHTPPSPDSPPRPAPAPVNSMPANITVQKAWMTALIKGKNQVGCWLAGSSLAGAHAAMRTLAVRAPPLLVPSSTPGVQTLQRASCANASPSNACIPCKTATPSQKPTARAAGTCAS